MAERKFPQMGLTPRHIPFGMYQPPEPTRTFIMPPPDSPGWRPATELLERLNAAEPGVQGSPRSPPLDPEAGDEDDPEAGDEEEPDSDDEPVPRQLACLHKERGCPATFYVSADWELHSKNCLYQAGKVMNCPDKACRGVNIPIMKFQTHFKNRHELLKRADEADPKDYFWLQKKDFQEDGKCIVSELKVGTFWFYLTAEYRPHTWPDMLALFSHMPNHDKDLTKGLTITYTLREDLTRRHIRTLTVGTCPPGATYDNTLGKNMAFIQNADLELCEKEDMEERCPGQEPILKTYYKIHFKAQYEEDE